MLNAEGLDTLPERKSPATQGLLRNSPKLQPLVMYCYPDPKYPIIGYFGPLNKGILEPLGNQIQLD